MKGSERNSNANQCVCGEGGFGCEVGNAWEGCKTGRPMETTLVAQGRVAWTAEVPPRWRDGETLETHFSTGFHGTGGLAEAGEEGGGAW